MAVIVFYDHYSIDNFSCAVETFCYVIRCSLAVFDCIHCCFQWITTFLFRIRVTSRNVFSPTVSSCSAVCTVYCLCRIIIIIITLSFWNFFSTIWNPCYVYLLLLFMLIFTMMWQVPSCSGSYFVMRGTWFLKVVWYCLCFVWYLLNAFSHKNIL